MSKTAKHVTKKRLAERAGLALRTVDNAVERGTIPSSCYERSPGGHIKFIAAYEDVIVNALVSGGRSAKADDQMPPRAQRDFYEAQLAEVKLKRELKELIPVEDVEREVTNSFSKLANRLLQMPAQLSAELHAAKTVHRVDSLLDAAIRERFADFRAEICGMVMQSGLDDGDPSGSGTPSTSSLN